MILSQGSEYSDNNNTSHMLNLTLLQTWKRVLWVLPLADRFMESSNSLAVQSEYYGNRNYTANRDLRKICGYNQGSNCFFTDTGIALNS